jgi:hypothetical protein
MENWGTWTERTGHVNVKSDVDLNGNYGVHPGTFWSDRVNARSRLKMLLVDL